MYEDFDPVAFLCYLMSKERAEMNISEETKYKLLTYIINEMKWENNYDE